MTVERPRILIVEDEFIVAFELKTALEDMGYEVCAIATSGEEAVARAEQIKPDCVLMDVTLKGEMDGIEAARHIWNRLAIRTAFLTGFPREEVMAKAREFNPIACFVKPLEYDQLEAALGSFLAGDSGDPN